MDAPRVFISHDSRDKQRFVLDFARRLQERGIVAWLDRWEMLPGDSIEDKIFKEGIGQAEAVIVVISANSIQSRWVSMELAAGLEGRVAGRINLIPVVIDHCDVPAALQSIVWETIDDLDSYEEHLERVVNAILNKRTRPELGPAPAYASMATARVPELSAQDVDVLRLLCDQVVGQDLNQTSFQQIEAAAAKIDVGQAACIESLGMLEEFGYIKAKHTVVASFAFVQAAPSGFAVYVDAFRPEFRDLERRVGFQIVNHKLSCNKDIAGNLELPLVVVDLVLDLMEQRGLLACKSTYPNGKYIYNVAPRLRRQLEGGA